MFAALAALAVLSPPPALKDNAVVLPVFVNETIADKTERALYKLLGRAALLKAFKERGITVLSEGMTIVMKEETDLDFADPSIWGGERFQLMANRWNARYVAGVQVIALEHTETAAGTQGGPPAPGVKLNTTIKLEGSLWDNKSKKFLFEKKPFEETYSVGRPGPSDQQIIDEKRQAVYKAGEKIFAEYLGKLPKVKLPPEKPTKSKGGGGR